MSGRAIEGVPAQRRQNRKRSQLAGEIELVQRFGATPRTFSTANDGVRLHVRPGCLRSGRTAGPVTIHTTGRYLVQCGGRAGNVLISEVVDFQPSGMRFGTPILLDFRVGEGKGELGAEEGEGGRHKGNDASGNDADGFGEREEYMRSLKKSYKVRHSRAVRCSSAALA